MSSCIYYQDLSLWVSNQRFSTLLEFALDVGDGMAGNPEEAAFVRRLREWSEAEEFNGCDFNLAERFPTTECRAFWASVFFEVGKRIFLRKLGNQEVDSWQASAICDAHTIARMIGRGPQSIAPVEP